MTEKACSECHRLVEEENECPIDKNNDLRGNWSGLAVIYDPENSEIAEQLETSVAGRYAINVR
ncbi:MAG: DNA-directed RNA polymerase, subunit E'' [Candidatus Nanosalina sp. J07AB43]|jgi:DNA-directed RNA polymerase, subunit E''''|nr:MAG: DNA-directed RNA polymerase, subunit E'' [Candidatus Nanosalina sp. J07AB43]